MSDYLARLGDALEDAMTAPPPPRRRLPGWVIAAAAFLGVIVVGAVWWGLTRPEQAVVGPSTTTTAVPPPTSLPEATTTTAAVTTTTAASLPTEPVHGGVVTIGIDVDLVFGYEDADGSHVDPTLNPLIADQPVADIARLVVPGVFRIEASGEIVPWLVEEIPRPGNGGLVVDEDGAITINYRVREEAVWEDGTPVTAADLAFTHQLILEHGRDDLRILHEIVEPGSLVVDGKVLSLRLTHPTPSYERLFEWVVPAHLIETDSFTEDWNDRLWPSAGPFRFVSLEVAGPEGDRPSVVHLERNPTYWEVDESTGERLPYLDGIDVQAFTSGFVDDQEIADFIRSGATDAALGSLILPFRRQWIGDAAEFGLVEVVDADGLIELMGFNLAPTRFDVNPQSLNDRLQFRRAVLAAIDRDRLAEQTNGVAIRSIAGAAGEAFEHGAWDEYSSLDPGALLAELGADEVVAVYGSSNGDATIRVGDAVVEQLLTAGIAATATYGGDFFGTEFPARLMDLFALRTFPGSGGMSGVAEALSFFEKGAESSVVDWTGLDDEADHYSDVVAAAQSELDGTRLAELIEEAESILADNALVYPLVRRQVFHRLYRPERVQGIVPHRLVGWETWNAASWWSPQG